jgi:SAM-dependent methyltransferase
MREIVRRFAEEVIAALPMAEPVVEIGSRPAEGQEDIADLRPMLAGKQFIGCDIQAGPGVDQIEDIHHLTFDDASVGTLFAFDTLEHVADPLRALVEVERVLKPGGVVAITSHMFMPIHAHPWDYWRFTPEGFDLLLRPFESRYVAAQGWHLMPEGVFGIAVKGPAELGPAQLPRTTRIAEQWGAGTRVDFGPIRLSARQMWGHTLRATREALAERVRGRRRPG